jgi:hypothetical protein
MTPLELFNRLREILAEGCGCRACWGQHPQPLSEDELIAIRSRVLQLFDARPPRDALNVDQSRRKSE